MMEKAKMSVMKAGIGWNTERGIAKRKVLSAYECRIMKK
jgi:hypothetical protein